MAPISHSTKEAEMYITDFTTAAINERSRSYLSQAARRRLIAALRCCQPSTIARAVRTFRARFTSSTVNCTA